MKKSLIVLLGLIMAMGIFLAACQSNSSGGEADAPKKTDDGGSSADSGNKDPLGKYDETVTVSMVAGYGKPEDAKTKQGVTPQSNAYITKLKDMLNIDLQYTWEVPNEQYEQKFSVSIASGDFPDIMQIDRNQFEKFKQQGILADLTDAYNDYASDELKAFMDFDEGKTLDLFTEDGKILGIPSYEDPYMSAQFLWIRKDWLDHLGLEVPKSLEDLEKVAQAFVDDDPDGNGNNDTYGLALHKDLISWGYDARGLFYTMGAYPKAWIDNGNGELIPGETQPETKEALNLMSKWYESGIIDKEFAFKDIDKVVEDFASGKVGISFGEWWYPSVVFNLSKENDPKADWVPVELPTFKGEESKTLVPGTRLNNVVVVHKDYQNPEVAVKMINFYQELEKPEYDDEVTPENGYVYNWFQPRIYRPDDFITAFKEVNEALDQGLDEVDSTNSTTLSVFDAAKKYLDEGDESMWGVYYSRAAKDGGWATVEKIREKENVVYDEFAGGTTPTLVSKGSSLSKMTDEVFTKIIMGSESVDKFDSYVKDWKNLGGEKITEEVNKWYKEK